LKKFLCQISKCYQVNGASYRPKDVKLLFIIGVCYLRLKQYDEAAEVFREILQKDSENLEAYQKLTSLQEISD
jgi:pentatricopeptide repeat protein